jgi:ABC transport system ATP-binding/permease protein
VPNAILTLKHIALSFGQTSLFEDLELNIRSGEHLALLGRNGAGKSSLQKIIAGLIEPDAGKLMLAPGTTVSYLQQQTSHDQNTTLLDFVSQGLHASQKDAGHRALSLLSDLSLDPHSTCGQSSGGELQRAAIARAVICDPDLLLLDEPTNHLDLPAIEWLEARLQSFRGGLLVVSHDRAFLERTARTCLWLDQGQLHRLDKGFEFFEDWCDDLVEKQESAKHKRNQLIARETKWLHGGGVTARRKRNQGRLKKLVALRRQRATEIKRATGIKISAQVKGVSGSIVIRARNVSKGFDGTLLFDNFSTIIRRKDRIGIIGPNGTGKTTLLKMLIGEIEPDRGSVELGTNLTPLFIDQRRADLDDEMSVREVLTGSNSDQIMVHGKPRHIVSYLRDFLFAGDQVNSPVKSLSGGEKNRLRLAKAFAKEANLVILDEPTNDLDMETLDLLEEMLANYEGTVLLISHDRNFLDRLVTSVIAFDGKGNIVEHAGGYSDFMERTLIASSNGTSNKTAKNNPKKNEKTKTTKKRLSFKQIHALKTLPGEIAGLEAKISNVEKALAAPELFGNNPDKYARLCKSLDQRREKLEAKEDQWLKLELLRDEVASDE